jgi:hypothetical protein
MHSGQPISDPCLSSTTFLAESRVNLISMLSPAARVLRKSKCWTNAASPSTFETQINTFLSKRYSEHRKCEQNAMRTTSARKPFSKPVKEFRAFCRARSLDEKKQCSKPKMVTTNSPRQKKNRWHELLDSYLKIQVERISNRDRQRHYKRWPKHATQYLAVPEGKHLSNWHRDNVKAVPNKPICSDKGQANTIFPTNYRPFITRVLKTGRPIQTTNTREQNGTVKKIRNQQRKRFQSQHQDGFPCKIKLKAAAGGVN